MKNGKNYLDNYILNLNKVSRSPEEKYYLKVFSKINMNLKKLPYTIEYNLNLYIYLKLMGLTDNQIIELYNELFGTKQDTKHRQKKYKRVN